MIFRAILFLLALACAGQGFAQIQRGQSSGPSVDWEGAPVVDPTENVKALMKASLEGLEKLRTADEKFNDAAWLHLKEMADLRAKHAEQLRLSDLSAADKTRQVDVMAATGSASTLATGVQSLASQTTTMAETLRAASATQAATLAKQTADAQAATQSLIDTMNRRFDERMTTVERAQATGAGRQSVADPQVEAMNVKLNTLLESRATVAGKGEGASAMWGYIVGGIGVLFAVASYMKGTARSVIYQVPPASPPPPASTV
jgi:hypothetical protein